MLLRVWRLLTIVMTALGMGPALGHVLEMPAKLQYDGALWVRLQQTLYASFGTVGAFFEVSAVILSVVLVVLVRARPRSLRWTLLGAACLVAAHVSFRVWLAPVNATVSGSSPDALPPDWEQLRSRWEITHAMRALLETAGLVALVVSVLVEVPDDAPGRSTPAAERAASLGALPRLARSGRARARRGELGPQLERRAAEEASAPGVVQSA